MRSLFRALVVLVLCAAPAVLLGGCKQGLGERCQIDSDCASGTCSSGDQPVCTGAVSTIDASPKIDAGPDAATLDAAPIDAAPIDAAPSDAAKIDVPLPGVDGG